MCYTVQEGEALGAYGEWVPVDKTSDKAAAASRKAVTTVPTATATSSSGETKTAPGTTEVVEQPVCVLDNDSVFPDPLLQVRSGFIPSMYYVIMYVFIYVNCNIHWCV